jgi:hypothetical protein
LVQAVQVVVQLHLMAHKGHHQFSHPLLPQAVGTVAVVAFHLTLVVLAVRVVVVGQVIELVVQATHHLQRHHRETMVVMVDQLELLIALVVAVAQVQSVLQQQLVVKVLLVVQAWLHLSQVHQ